ncbi:hypothetical protein H6P81_006704 [Aristolochia fimbriata]|uniref:Uncharacterized protein n=1 Tax=Aristolochia fimbriata TaxID=158543 RepID=A0AAV7EY20_ARIFI|nr:hypothetical protein H6P81_006704 [Aristolochia fimbriata]
MTDIQKSKPKQPLSSADTPRATGGGKSGGEGSFSGHKYKYPNPPESEIPDAATLREQWRFAIRHYGKWYSHAWGTAILAGGAFFALGWVLKGGNPLPSSLKDTHSSVSSDSEGPTLVPGPPIAEKLESSDNMFLEIHYHYRLAEATTF